MLTTWTILRDKYRMIIASIPVVSLLLPACTPEKPASTADLHFPVVILYSSAAIKKFKDASDLQVMTVQTVINQNKPPVLIDTGFDVFTLEKLRSIHGGLWLMTHPSGITDVAFDLKRAPNSGLDAARAAIREQLDIQTWRDDLPQRRRKLASQTTLSGMVDLLRDEENQ